MEEAIISNLIAQFGPWGLIVAILLAGQIMLWRSQQKLITQSEQRTEDFHKIAISSVKAIEESNERSAATRRALEDVLRVSQTINTNVEVIKSQTSS